MAASRKVKDTWIRSFTVTDPTKHEKGFTVYKLTYRAISLKNPEEIIETVVWKRYNDFKKLHSALYQLHYNLRRPEKFPVFAKAKFFGRFDDDVIEERRQSALRLLEFASTIGPLTRTNFFKRFFEGGEEVAIKQSHQGKILQPQVVLPVSANGTTHQSTASTLDAASTTPEEGREHGTVLEGHTGSPSLGGVWLHRKTEEDLTEYETMDYDEDGEDDEDDRTTFSEDSVPSTPLPQVQDMSFFDPLSDTEHQGTDNSTKLPQSNSWLFQAMDMCAILSEDSPDNSTVTDSTTDLSTDSGITINFPKPGSEPQTTGLHGLDPAVNKVNEVGTTIPDESSKERMNERSTMARAYLNCIRAQQAAERDAMYPDGGMVDSRTLNVRPWSDDSGSMDVGNVIVGGEEDYLYQAAYHISLALENEANGSYQAAFNLYKSGVGVLLKGVIADDNKARREAVRRKTAQYLMKAEDLYNKYLSADATNSRRWEPEPTCIDIDPRSAHLRGSPEELKNFKVLGLIDSVLLVLDTTSYQTFVIKVLQKCSIAGKRATSVPPNCRYVVKLCRCIETDDAIYLVLEHASGGKLWSYASGFLNHRTEASYNEAVAGSLERSVDSEGLQHGSSISKEGEKCQDEKCQDEMGDVFLHPDEASTGTCDSAADYSRDLNRITPNKSPAETLSEGTDSYANLIINYGDAESSNGLRDFNPQIERSSISNELADLDIQDTEANLNELADQCSQYDNIGVHSGIPDVSLSEEGKDTFNELKSNTALAPMSLFSIDSIESPSSDLHSAGSVDKMVFGFGTPQTSPKPNEERATTHPIHTAQLPVWSDHNPEEVIADALKVMEHIEKDRDSLGLGVETSNDKLKVSDFDGFRVQPLEAKNVDTLPDTSGFTSAMADDMTVSTPGTDLAEFFDSNFAGNSTSEMSTNIPPPPLKHSMSMYEREGLNNSPPRHRNYSNPLDLRATRSVSFESQSSIKDDVLSSLMQSSVEDQSGFESVSIWESMNKDYDTAKNQPDLSEVLGETSSNSGLAGNKIQQLSSTVPKSKENLKQPSVTLPQDLNLGSQTNLTNGKLKGPLLLIHPSVVSSPNNLSPTSNQDGSDATLHSSCESTPKHAVYSPEFDSGAVMDSPSIDGPDLSLGRGKSLSDPAHENSVNDGDLTPSETNNIRNSPTFVEEGKSPVAKTRKAPLPSLTTLFAQMDEHVSVTKSRTLPESCICLWAAEILQALTDLHTAGIICQDLQPDNILLAEGGHVRLTYFSQWQYVERTPSTFAKENFYTAPEVNGIFNVTPACDWWSFGVLLFELLTGTSLHSCHPSGINSHTQLIIPDHVSAEASSLIRQLLQVNPQERLGSQRAGGAEEIRIHQFFRDINWTSLQKTAYS